MKKKRERERDAIRLQVPALLSRDGGDRDRSSQGNTVLLPAVNLLVGYVGFPLTVQIVNTLSKHPILNSLLHKT